MAAQSRMHQRKSSRYKSVSTKSAHGKALFVIDASFILSFLLDETSKVDALIERLQRDEVTCIAPSLLWFEVANGLRSAVVRKRLSEKLALQLYTNFLMLGIDPVDVHYDEVLKFSMKNKISCYDGAYAWLSKNQKAGLLTLDNKLSSLP